MIDSSASRYPRAEWRLLITPPLDGATNMAIDEAILQALAEGDGRPTVRFFQWEPACLSLGYNQHWTDIDLAALAQHGYTWTRRPTGGKAILHTDEATYSLIIPQDDPRIEGGVVESYRILSLGLLRGLHRLGLNAEQASREEARTKRQETSGGGPVCFDTPSVYEITVNGKKLIGSAQLRRKKIVLQHGTLPLVGNLNRIIDVLDFPPDERAAQHAMLPERALTVEQALGRVISFDAAIAALEQGFAEQLNLKLEPAGLTPREQKLAEQLRAAQYANESWLRRV
ncbi:MAG: Octanoyltransferase LipM [Anaerolineae bacterium]|nr:Octanoyltransferase LipM [Anaerolineae bacterium]